MFKLCLFSIRICQLCQRKILADSYVDSTIVSTNKMFEKILYLLHSECPNGHIYLITEVSD